MAVGSFSLPISSGGGEWVRPADWLPMPTGITSANDTFVGLHAVIENGDNYCAFLFTTSAGQYRVDWGDGTVTLHNSNTIAQYQYNYASISNSTLSTRGYKQVIITVTAVSGLLRSIDLQRRFVTSPIQNQNSTSGFLDCILSMPNASVGQSVIIGSTTVAHRYVERFDIKTMGGNNRTSNFFFNFLALQSVPLFNMSTVQLADSMFFGCRSLKSIPLFNTQNVTTMFSFFNSCYSLESAPLLNTANVTTMQNMFSGCAILKSVPLFNTQNVTNMNSMFTNCNTLQEVPLFNTSNVSIMTNIFQQCNSLLKAPLLNTSNVTVMNGMFAGCLSLSYVPNYNTLITTTSGSDFTTFCDTCNSLDRCEMIFSRSVGFQQAQLSRTALVEIFNNLVDRTLTTSATITITGNWGASALTAGERLIATSKNWIIVG